jgi:hypothetical protein
MKTPPGIENARSADIRGSWPALLRAARRAREIAAQTGTAIVVTRNGVMELVYPGREAPREADEPGSGSDLAG